MAGPRMTKQRIRAQERRVKHERASRGKPVSPRLTDREVRALLKCDEQAKASRVVDELIRRETELIQTGWTERERLKRQQPAVVPWSIPTEVTLVRESIVDEC